MRTKATKLQKLELLARKRRRAKWPGYSRIGDYHNGIHECPHVSPYTKSADNVNSPVMIILQDWTSHDLIQAAQDPETIRLGYTPSLRTNAKLVELLKVHFDFQLKDTFVTNLFPFIKKGGISAPIPFCDLKRAATEYGIPQIQIVQPKLAVCLGLGTFNAVREASGRCKVRTVAEAINSPFKLESTDVWCQAHTGGQGQAMRNRGRHRVTSDWRRMARSIGFSPE